MAQEQSAQSSVASLFELLERANNTNIESKKPTILGTTSDALSNGLFIFTSTLGSVAKSMELANSYISEELDKQVGSRTTTKVDVVYSQLTDINRLVSLGATFEEATNLATSYRR